MKVSAKVMNLNETTKNKPTLHQFGIRKGDCLHRFGGLSAVVLGFFRSEFGD